MTSKQLDQFETIYSEVTHQDMSISGHQEDPNIHPKVRRA